MSVVTRQFRMVYLLLEKGRMTAGELAEKLEVSPRTILRDVDALSAAGVPVYTTQGGGGGVALLPGHVLDRAAFTDEEQRQLLTALQSLPNQEGEQALTKLSALFRRGPEDWLQVNLSRWGAGPADNAKFRLLKQAVLERQTLSFGYAGSYGSTRARRVLPARLVFKGQGWYLQAFDLEREDYRTFRLSRILSPAFTGEVFHRRLEPPDIDFPGDIPPLFRVEVRLRFAPCMPTGCTTSSTRAASPARTTAHCWWRRCSPRTSGCTATCSASARGWRCSRRTRCASVLPSWARKFFGPILNLTYLVRFRML